MSKRIIFVIDETSDQDIVRWLDAQGNRSAAIRTAIRNEMRRLSADDIRRIVREELSAFNPALGGGDGADDKDSDEDEALASRLDSIF